MRSFVLKGVFLCALFLTSIAEKGLPVNAADAETGTVVREDAGKIDLTNAEHIATNEESQTTKAAMPNDSSTKPIDDPIVSAEQPVEAVEKRNTQLRLRSGLYGWVEEEILPVASSNSTKGNHDEVEQRIAEQPPVIQNEDIGYRLTPLGFIVFTSGIIALFIAAVLLLSSVYYRLYLKRNKCAPFDMPTSFSALFPQPTNPEYEMEQLCSRYLDN